MKSLSYPNPLKPGDKVALTAPSSPVPGINLSTAISSVEMLGLVPIVMKSCYEKHGYLAGVDAIRANDINEAFTREDIRGIFCLRGGYGATRILPFLDFETIKNNPKVFIGYSDITALHTSINKLCGFVTFHGPMPNTDYSRLDDFSINSLKTELFNPYKMRELNNPEGENLSILNPEILHQNYLQLNDKKRLEQTSASISGVLTGGNISLLTGTLGSPYEIDTKDKILFLEDVGERPYRLDKGLTALSLAGKFRDCSGIIIGTFSDCEESEHNKNSPNTNIAEDTLNIMEIIEEVILPWKKPTLFNFRAGHIYPQITMPLGACINIDLNSLKITI